LLKLRDGLVRLRDRKSAEAKAVRDEIDCAFLNILGYGEKEISSLLPGLRKSLEDAIRFRWVKTRMRQVKTT